MYGQFELGNDYGTFSSLGSEKQMLQYQCKPCCFQKLPQNKH